jgi:hypothetical protein
MTPEASFLLECVRRFLGSSDGSDVQPTALDETALVELATKHSVLALLPDLPKSKRKEQVCFNLGLMAELLRLLGAFQAAEIPVLSLKGPVFAETAYGDLVLRTFVDIDLLVRPADRDRACRLLVREGYLLTVLLHWPESFRSKEDQLLFHCAERGVRVDLHWSLLPSYYPQPIHPGLIWDHLKPVRIAGRSVSVLGDEDLLLFLCAHGAKHVWNRLGWICDVGRVLQVCRRLDWSLALLKAQEQRCRHILLLGLALSHEILGSPLPEEISKMISADNVACSCG